jgi:hypothetical protein
VFDFETCVLSCDFTPLDDERVTRRWTPLPILSGGFRVLESTCPATVLSEDSIACDGPD